MATVWRCDCCKIILEKSSELTSICIEGEYKEDTDGYYNRHKEKEIKEDWCKSCILSLRNFIKEFRVKALAIEGKL